MSNEDLLKTSISAAVPLWAMQFQSEPWESLQKQIPGITAELSERGDLILHKSRKKGQTATAFNALARCIAILSFAPGGVDFLGMHFENKHKGEEVPVCSRCGCKVTMKHGHKNDLGEIHDCWYCTKCGNCA